MTVQKAKARIADVYEFGKKNKMIDKEDVDYYETVIAALEKQMPKKPNFEGDGYDENGYLIYDTWICPCCEEKYEVDYEEHKHCPNCGQAIDWSDTE